MKKIQKKAEKKIEIVNQILVKKNMHSGKDNRNSKKKICIAQKLYIIKKFLVKKIDIYKKKKHSGKQE